MSRKISIIIPVYNAEKYVSKCIDSLLNQTFQDFEIILVNDGSTDDSVKICREYAECDNRIILIDRENGGVCTARNAGLDVATGEMITFVDADDWMPENSLQLLYSEYKRTNADLVIGDISFVNGGKTSRIRVFDKAFTTRDPSWINQYEIACIGYGYNPNPGTKMNVTGLGSMGNKLYRRRIIEANQLRFDPYTMGIYEDNLFVLHYLELCDCISYISESVYFYRKVLNSNSRGYKENTLEISSRIFEKIEEYIKEFKPTYFEEFNKALYIYIIRRLDSSLFVYFFAKESSVSLKQQLASLKHLINSEPYKTAILNVDSKRLNPKSHKITWLTARTNSALFMWFSVKARTFLEKILNWLRAIKLRLKAISD